MYQYIVNSCLVLMRLEKKPIFFCIDYTRVEVRTHKTSLTPSLFIEVPVHQSRKASAHAFECLRFRFLPLSAIFLLDFGTLLIVWYCFVIQQ